jgi:hypothetical protein
MVLANAVQLMLIISMTADSIDAISFFIENLHLLLYSFAIMLTIFI